MQLQDNSNGNGSGNGNGNEYYILYIIRETRKDGRGWGLNKSSNFKRGFGFGYSVVERVKSKK